MKNNKILIIVILIVVVVAIYFFSTNSAEDKKTDSNDANDAAEAAKAAAAAKNYNLTMTQIAKAAEDGMMSYDTLRAGSQKIILVAKDVADDGLNVANIITYEIGKHSNGIPDKDSLDYVANKSDSVLLIANAELSKNELIKKAKLPYSSIIGALNFQTSWGAGSNKTKRLAARSRIINRLKALGITH
jgi:uncharacterized membrane protein